MYCGQCGKEIKDSSVFCPYCGSKMEVTNIDQEKKSPESVINAIGLLRNICAVLSIVFLISGVFCGKVSDSYKPADVAWGAMIDGKLVIHEKYENALGGNTEGVKTYKNLSILCYVMAAGCLLGTIILSGSKAKIENAKQVEYIGKILEKRENMITVEFKNGERKYFSVEPSIIVMAGDFGKMTFQSGILIAFQKMKER